MNAQPGVRGRGAAIFAVRVFYRRDRPLHVCARNRTSEVLPTAGEPMISNVNPLRPVLPFEVRQLRAWARASTACVALFIQLGTAAAHSWYPKRCCNHGDCHPADKVERLPDGTLVLSHGSIVVRVTRSFPVEASADGRAHFCVYDSGWGPEARCAFLPAGS